MIRTTDVFRIMPGHDSEAVGHLGSVRDRLRDVSGADVQLLTRLGGLAGQVALSGLYDSLGAWEAALDRMRADPEWTRMTAEAGRSRMFIPGTSETVLWRVE